MTRRVAAAVGPSLPVVVAGLLVTTSLTAPAARRPVKTASTRSFCAAVRRFNAARPSSRPETLTALRALEQAAVSDAKPALERILRAASRGNPAAVLTEATNVETVTPTPLTVAGRVVETASDQRCHVTVNFAAAVPRGVSREPVPAREWVRTVCTSLASWGSRLRDAGSNLATPANGVTTTLSEVRNSVTAFIGSALLSTQALIDELGQAGIPVTTQGRAFAQFLRDGVSQAQLSFAAARPAAAALPDDPRAFQLQAQALVQRLDGAGSAVQALVRDGETRIGDRRLTKAFAAEPGCAGIG